MFAALGAAQDFDGAVKPFLTRACSACHNERMASGGLNVKTLGSAQTLETNREEWEKIVRKLRTGEMPPPPLKKPPQDQIDQVLTYVRAEFEKADRKLKPDPGRVTVRRLNRAEYSNTIRDLLGVDFRADESFPTDDSGHGFDNIGDVLTVSPVLLEKYVQAAERISARALGIEPLPKPLEAEYHPKDRKIRRVDWATIEASHRVEWDAEYIVRVGLPGERAPDGKPVMMGFWMDGKLLHTMQVETKPSKLEYFEPFSEAQFQMELPEGNHTFRVAFIDDPFVREQKLEGKAVFDRKKNKYPNSITFVGPYPLRAERASRKRILSCDPNTGEACVKKIMTELARRAYRRPVTAAEVSSLLRFAKLARAEGQSWEEGLQVAMTAMLVSPHFLFRVERDTDPMDSDKSHPVSDFELASRLSYFLWSSMPDETLVALAESGKLRAPGVLDAQVKRMLADERASALAENFAGQWLEIRNLDQAKPDPQKFPEWNPTLKDAMRTETTLFFKAMLDENRPLPEFIDAKFTFLNDVLARHYGVPGVEGPEFRRVELATDQRGGILSHASVLTVSSYPTRTSPVIRGKYVLENILGAPPPPPPPDVPTLDEEAVGEKLSLRQQMEQHRSNPVCASCHQRMDVLGFGLENYDATGKWRTKDGKFDLDVAGTFPSGKSFRTPAEMKLVLKEDVEEFGRCVTEKMLTYALGRGLERYDRRTIDALLTRLKADNYRFQTLVYEIVRSLPFQSRRGEALRSESPTPTKELASR